MICQESPEAVAARLTDAHASVLRICAEYPSSEFAGAWIRSACIEQACPFGRDGSRRWFGRDCS